MVYYCNKLYISDWRRGKIWSGTIKGTRYEPKILKSRFVNPADICITSDGKDIVIPEMMFENLEGGRVSFFPID